MATAGEEEAISRPKPHRHGYPEHPRRRPSATTGKDAAKRVPWRKKCLAVDVLGLVVEAVALPASAHDSAAGIPLLDGVAAQMDTVAKANRWIVEQMDGTPPSPRLRAPVHHLALARLLGDDFCHVPPAHRRHAALLEGPHERQPAGQRRPCLRRGPDERARQAAGQLRASIEDLTACLGELDAETESLRITRTALLNIPIPEPADDPPRSEVPHHPACRQILAAFTDTGRPMRAGDLCEALDLPIPPKNTEGIRSNGVVRDWGWGVLAWRVG
ncbi:transposase [Streptomyces mirabilis]|uniref:transposase n=1 Tax=Streptomyces mirabilis TaxID=68239 RepID=UPI00378D8872